MEAHAWFETLVADCRWVRSVEQAMGLVPGLGLDGPRPVAVRLEGDQPPFRGLPVAFSDRLWRVTARTLNLLMEEGIRQGGPWPVDESELEVDDLVGELARLLLEATPLGPAVRSLVVLEAARQCSLILSADLAELESVSPGVAAGLRRRVEALVALAPANQGRVLSGLVLALSARLGAAHALAARIDPRVAPTSLLQALLANRLALAFAPGHIDLERDIERLVACLDMEVDPPVVAGILRAVRAGVERALAGEGGVLGMAIRDAMAPTQEADAGALDPLVATMTLHALPDLLSARQLRSAGLSREQARSLLDREGAVSAAAIHRRLSTELLRWDLLAACMKRCLPVRAHRKGWTSSQGDLAGSLRWRALAPSSGPRPVELWMVEVDLGPLWLAAAQAGVNEGETAVLAGVSGRWSGLLERQEAQGGLAVDCGGTQVVLFEREEDARTFAELVEDAFRGPFRVDLDPVGGSLNLPADALPEVRVRRRSVLLAWAGGRPWFVGGLSGGATEDTDEERDEAFDWLGGHSEGEGATDPFAVEQAPPVEAREVADPFAGDDVAASAPADEPPAGDPFGAGDEPPAGDPFAAAPAAPSSPPPPTGDPFADPFAAQPEPAADEPEAGGGPDWEPEAAGDEEGPGEALLVEEEEPGVPPAVDLGFMDEPATDPEPTPPSAASEPSGPSASGQAGGPVEGRFGPVLEIIDEEDDDLSASGISETSSSGGDTAERYVPPPVVDEEGGPGEFRFPSLEAESLDSLSLGGHAQAEAAAEKGAIPGFDIEQIRPLFEGYVTYRESADRVVFGRPYGSTVLDRHVYTWEGDIGRCYRAFLRDKVAEGFVPRTDLTGRLPPGVTPKPLDFDRLGEAIRELA